MLRRRHNKYSKGQVLVEYSLIIGIVAMILMAMNVTIKRGIQGMVKVVADQVGTQINAEQKFDKSGHMESSYTSVRSDTDKRRTEQAGVVSYLYNDSIETNSKTVSNLGFQPTN